MAVAAGGLRDVALDDKYRAESGWVYLSGIQALVRLPLMQQRRDRAAGLDTAGFISGYRGSPLGGLDMALWQARDFLDRHRIHFQPGLNEDLGATAVWGSQQVNLWPGATADGVFALWYAKGPGIDRSLDALRHANAAGTSPLGGVLALAGDDHAAKSSTMPHQSEYAFMHALMPVLNPAGVQEIIDYGLLGWALSRHCGCWVALKTIAETVDSSTPVRIDPDRGAFVLPEDPLPPRGLSIRWPDPALEQEERLLRFRLEAARAFVRVNRLDRALIDSPPGNRRLGIVTTGKSSLDVRQALEELGLSDSEAADLGLSLYKVAMPWPLEPDGIRAFAEGLEEILVVEEKRPVIESQLKEQLYNWRADVRPLVLGKTDEQGAPLLPAAGELSAAGVALVIGRRLLRFHRSEAISRRLAFLEAEEHRRQHRIRLIRQPTFCPGCPHNRSTVVPEGSRAIAGIGCHYMATWMDRHTETFTQMGGEGVPWIGQAPFTETGHVFANLGDGTWFHSGSLAIRAALAAGVSITYKILYNDAVAMTGGQPLGPGMSVARLTRELAAEGVTRIEVVTDQPEKYHDAGAVGLGPGVTVSHRTRLEQVQTELRCVAGVSVLIYDQTCAAEKRRRRHRGTLEDPARRVVINEAVCEGCGDCSRTSNCVSVVPVDTDYGRKRRIDQSSCNKDLSCLEGFCPSLVTVIGGRLRRPTAAPLDPSVPDVLPEPPERPALDRPYNIVITGVGGTGVITIGALLGMAAHLEAKGVSVLDMTGLAQKGGAVTSHVRIAASPDGIHAVRIAAGDASLVLGGDLVVTAAGETLSKMAPGRTRVVLNRTDTITLDFTHDPDFRTPAKTLLADIRAAVHENRPGAAVFTLEAGRLAASLLGDSIFANLMLLGFAWQKGLIPLSEAALLRAIDLNGTEAQRNRQAFAWGRRAAHDPAAVTSACEAETPPGMDPRPIHALDAVIARRMAELTAYQDAAYAARYHAQVDRVRALEAERTPQLSGLTEAVARNYFKLLAYKDEYEVARLFANGAFRRQLAAQFEGPYRVRFHLAPPLLSRPDPETGQVRKRDFGGWMMPVFRLLAHCKGLRGSRFDPLAGLPERRLDRRLITEYEATLGELLAGLTPANHRLAVRIAALPERIRGYGHIRERAAAEAKALEQELLAGFRSQGRSGTHSPPQALPDLDAAE